MFFKIFLSLLIYMLLLCYVLTNLPPKYFKDRTTYFYKTCTKLCRRILIKMNSDEILKFLSVIHCLQVCFFFGIQKLIWTKCIKHNVNISQMIICKSISLPTSEHHANRKIYIIIIKNWSILFLIFYIWFRFFFYKIFAFVFYNDSFHTRKLHFKSTVYSQV